MSPGCAPSMAMGPVRAWIRLRSMCWNWSTVVSGGTWAPLESWHSRWTISPGAMWRRGGSWLLHTEWVGIALRVCSAMLAGLYRAGLGWVEMALFEQHRH